MPMAKIKTIFLKNYCGYRDITINFNEQMNVFYAPNGLGKCLTGNCFVNTEEYGQIRMRDIFEGINVKDDTWYNKEFKIDINGGQGQVKKIYYNGKNKTIKITTSSGFSIEGSKDRHSILSVKNGAILYNKLCDLKEGDFVCISRKSKFQDKTKDKISEETAKILGYVISEGCTTPKGMRFFNSEDEILENFCDLVEKEDKYRPKIKSEERRGHNRHISLSACYSDKLRSLGIKNEKSGDKTVPQIIMNSSEKIVGSFLSSYFEGDGGVENNDTITCCSKSPLLMEQIHLLLLRMGIISSLKKKKSKLNYTNKYPNGYTSWRITISGHEDMLLFKKKIGFISQRKIKDLDKIIKNGKKKQRNPNKDIIPVSLFMGIRNFLDKKRTEAKKLPNTPKRNKKGTSSCFDAEDYADTSTGLHCLQKNYLDILKLGVSNDKMKKCCNTIGRQTKSDVYKEIKNKFSWLKENYFFDTIKKKEEGYDDLYDLCVEKEHCFWSNGFISHNSFLLKAVALLSSASRHANRDTTLEFRKITYDPDYNPSTQEYSIALAGLERDENGKIIIDNTKPQMKGLETRDPEYLKKVIGDLKEMEIKGVFKTPAGEKEVEIHTSGVKKDELSQGAGSTNFHYFIDADHPSNSNAFQLPEECEQRFIELAEASYGYKCLLGKRVESLDKRRKKIQFYTDFILHKPWGDKVHFKCMSGGEKKIATLLRYLCDPEYMTEYEIILIDNIEKEIYWKRHEIMVNKLLQMFPDKQFIATTHSAILPKVLPKEYLYDLEEYKIDEAKRLGIELIYPDMQAKSSPKDGEQNDEIPKNTGHNEGLPK